MSDPTPQQVDWYIKWYNSLPTRVSAKEPWDGKHWRRICPDCGEPMVAKKNAAGEVYIDLQHKPDCGLHADWIKFEKENPGHSPGTLYLMFCNAHRSI